MKHVRHDKLDEDRAHSMCVYCAHALKKNVMRIALPGRYAEMQGHGYK